jgi:hypothetical protein
MVYYSVNAITGIMEIIIFLLVVIIKCPALDLKVYESYNLVKLFYSRPRDGV